MSEPQDRGCREYNELSRRQFLTGMTAAAALAATMPAWVPQVAMAQEPSATRDILVSIYLRGGADGLSLCVPYAEPNYYALRPNIAIPPPDSNDPNHAIDLNGFFGFPQGMAGLLQAYQMGHLLMVHATGSADPSRSHFDAQHFMEVGKPEDPSLQTGWLARHLLSIPPLVNGSILRGIDIDPGLQQTLMGAPLTLPIPDPGSFNLTGNPGTLASRSAWIQQVYNHTPKLMKLAAQNTQNTIQLLQQINFAGYQPSGGAMYPNTTFGMALKSAAALIKAQVGVEAIHVDIGGWDTHVNEGPANGYLAGNMSNFAQTLGAFHTDMFYNTTPNLTLVGVSEFGRNVAENYSQGTDHGHGNVMFVMGGHIAGGQVLTNWPGLQDGELYQGQDLQVTIDYRDILAEIVAKRLMNNNLSYVFPDYTPTFRGVTTS